MKKLIALTLVLLIMGTALAETTFTPAMFLGSRGLVVMDEKQMGGGNTAEMWDALGDATICWYSVSSTGSDSIAFTDDGTMYAAFDMTAMFGGKTADLSQVFVDFCQAYDFDCYTVQTEGNTSSVSFIKSADFPLDKVEASGGDMGLLVTSMDSFLESVADLAANRPEPEAAPSEVPDAEPTEEPAELPAAANNAPVESVGIDGEFTLGDVSFTVPGVYRYTEDGREYAVIRFDWANNSGEPMSFSDARIYATVYQDGIELPDGYIRMDTNTSKKVLPGYVLTSYRASELTSTSDVIIYLYGYDADYDEVKFTNVTIPYDSLGEM